MRGPAQSEHKWLPCRHRGEGWGDDEAGGTELPRRSRAPPPPTPPLDRPPTPELPPLPQCLFFSFLSFFFLNAPGGFLPAASWLPGWRDKADILKALPQAIPLLPMVQELEPKLHRELEARRDSEKSGLSPGATGTEACHCLFSPTRHFIFVFCLGAVFLNYLKDRKQGVPKSRIRVCCWATGVQSSQQWGGGPQQAVSNLGV